MAKKTSELDYLSSLTDARFVLLNDPDGVPVTGTYGYANLFSSVSVTSNFSNTVTFTSNVTVNNMHVSISTPVASNVSCVEGKIWFDADYIYCATANNTVKRAALSSF